MSRLSESSVTSGTSYKSARSVAATASTTDRTRRALRRSSGEATASATRRGEARRSFADLGDIRAPFSGLQVRASSDEGRRTRCRHVVDHSRLRLENFLSDQKSPWKCWVESSVEGIGSKYEAETKFPAYLPTLLDEDLTSKASVFAQHSPSRTDLNLNMLNHIHLLDDLSLIDSSQKLYPSRFPEVENTDKPNSTPETDHLDSLDSGSTIQASPKGARPMRTCYILILSTFLIILTSVALALWKSVKDDDVSGGFTLGQYIVAAGGLVIFGVITIHARTCVCWKKRREDEIELL